MSVNQAASAKKNYYVDVEMQLGARAKVTTETVDRDLKNVLTRSRAPQGGGGVQTSQAEMENVVRHIVDGGVYGKGERPIVKFINAASDDRKTVKMNGKQYRISDPAEQLFAKAMPKFFGGLRKGDLKGMTAEQAIQQITQIAQQLGSQQSQSAQQG